MQKVNIRIIGYILVVLFVSFVCINLYENIAKAEEISIIDEHFIGYSENVTREELHQLTRIPSHCSDAPAITILVPGQGGDASHFSNDGTGNFCYEMESIADCLSNVVAYDINLYYATFDN